MRFWDSSAIVPLLIRERASGDMRALLRDDSGILTSFLTAVEVSSAVWRRLHKGELDAGGRADADAQFAALSNNWSEAGKLQRITEIALDLLTRHPMRAADAIQLASAIDLVGEADKNPSSLPFVTLDHDLASAARAEGFPVLP